MRQSTVQKSAYLYAICGNIMRFVIIRCVLSFFDKKSSSYQKNTTANIFSFIFHKKQFFILQQRDMSELNVYLNGRNAHNDILYLT